MGNVFNIIPSGFFNPLSSGSNNVANVACLLEIYKIYDAEISYRISRKNLRDMTHNNVKLEQEVISWMQFNDY